MPKTNLNKAVKICHKLAKEKGWWNKPRSPLEIHALIHSEISEATEAARDGLGYYTAIGKKPEGEAIELIDAVIRIFDYFGYKGWSFENLFNAKLEYNKKRAYRHGGKHY